MKYSYPWPQHYENVDGDDVDGDDLDMLRESERETEAARSLSACAASPVTSNKALLYSSTSRSRIGLGRQGWIRLQCLLAVI